MKRAVRNWFIALAFCLPMAGIAEPSGKALFAKPVVLRGMLGETQIQANLRAKEDLEDGFEGEYFLFGQSQKILMVGEIDGDEFLAEESTNGTDVSGQWIGKLAGDTISGEWESADGEITKPFQLRVMPAGAVKPGK